MVKMKEEIESIKNYALENNVPIMQDDGINYLTNYIKKNKIKKILEIYLVWQELSKTETTLSSDQ